VRNRSRIFSTLLVCLLLAAPALVLAQTTGTIEGTITDQSGAALPGVTVDLAGASLQGARSAVTSADGRYRFLSVAPGAYTVTATLSGFGRVQKKATVTLDATVNASLQLNLSTTAEVTVTGEAPLIDTSSTTGGSTYTAKVMSGLPLGRNYTDVVKSNPGVNEDRGETQGRANALTIYGATSVENQYIIDGVNTTNVIKGFQGKSLNGEFIQEVEVKTGGYQAEYGRALGGVVNVITKSGGNEFHGDAFAYYDSFGTRAKQDLCPLTGTAPDGTTCNGTGPDTLVGMRIADYEKLDGGFDLGGYVWKDRIWFFMAYDRVIYPTQTVGRFADSAAVSNNEQFPLNQWDNLYSGKLTFNIAQGTTLTGSYFYDPSVIEGAAGSDPRQSRVATITSESARTWESRRDIGGQDWGVRLNQLIGSVGLVQLQAAQHKDRYQLKPSGAGSGIRYNDFSCDGGTADQPCDVPTVQNSTTGGFGQIFGPTVNNYSKRMMYKGDFTFYLGNNEVKAGVDYQKGVTNAISFYTGIGEGGYAGGQTVGIFNEYGQQYYQHQFYAPCANKDDPACYQPINNIIAPSSADLGWYIQDSFKVTPSFTINAGLRWDKEDVNDYTGATAFSTTNEWQPRIGVIWDPNANGQMKIYAFYGRFYYSLPTDLNVRAYGAQTNGTSFNFDPVDTTQDPTVIGHETAFFQGGAFTEPVQPNLKGIYQDEVSAGFDMLLDPSFSVGVKGMYRNLGNTIEDRCDLDGTSPLTNFNTCAIINPGSDSALALGQVPGCNGLDGLSAGCFDSVPPIGKAKRTYWGGELVARKQFTNALWAQASVVYSSLRGNYDGEVREGRGQTDPGINADFDYFEFQHNNEGKLFLDVPWRFRVDASYTFPFKMYAGMNFYLQSGAPLNKQGYFNSGYGAEIQLVERGTAQTLPSLYEMNLTLGYPIALGPVTITPQLYVFNLFNKQQVTLKDVRYSTSQPAGYTNCSGVTFESPCTLYDPNQDQTNPNYNTFTQRQAPRLFRFALKVSF
jgi:TonB dependent receptor/Carboxypeptidase regulatory-like domain/TonB-dependent Receptor Plug Domain